MRRFWTRAEVASSPSGFSILLDGRPVRLPEGGGPLHVTSAPLAAAIAEEWQAAGDEVAYADLPLTRLAGTAQARVRPRWAANVAALAAYGATDLLCYRAEAPAELVERQARAWQPWLDWAALTLDAPLRVTAGVMPVTQPESALTALSVALQRQTAEALTALGVLVPLLGSLVLGLAVADQALLADDAVALATLDERYQAELWGEDPEAVARQQNIRAESLLAGRFLALARG